MLLGVQEVASSNLAGPTIEASQLQTQSAFRMLAELWGASASGCCESRMEATTNARIVKTPGTCGGRARVAGHRVRVQDIVIWYEHQGMTPDEIVSQIPSVTLADVHGALAYYFDHVEEIQEELRADQAFAEEFRRNHPSLLDAKLGREPLQEAS
jgi:uncharacterized protein (DUF433 family)